MIGLMSERAERFRTDIASLRAVAVLLVLANHFGVPGFHFGFIGVDIFFVISGFLITRVLFKEYAESSMELSNRSSISLVNFYLRRIRRLLPAALVVILVVNLISFFAFNDAAQERLIGDSKWATMFLANIAFLRSGADYFQQTNEPSMLQHYWSLSVEEQFYFIWPLLFLLSAHFHKLKIRKKLFRFNKRLLILISTSSILSFIFLQTSFNKSPVSAYFSIFTRAWELGIGSILGILAFYKSPRHQFSFLERILPLLLSIIFSFFFINSSNWAYWILLPTLGTGFLLYAGQDSVVPRNDSHSKPSILTRLLVYIGGISYSLYLIHWPIFILARHYWHVSTLWGQIALFPISILAANLLCRYIEKPFQRISLPTNLEWDKNAFRHLSFRRGAIVSIILVIVGSLYLVTYPSTSAGLLGNARFAADLSPDPNLDFYAKYENQLTSGSTDSLPNVSSETQTPTSNLTLEELLKANKSAISTGLSTLSISAMQAQQIPSLKTSVSPFEFSKCNLSDTEVPIDCKVGNRNSGAKRVALIGDSKMGHFAQPIIDYFTARNWLVVPMSMSGCHMSDMADSDLLKNCKQRANWVSTNIAKEKYDLVISAEWPSNKLELKSVNVKYWKNIIVNSGEVIILEQIPKIGNPVDCVKGDNTFSALCLDIPEELINSWNYTNSLLQSFSSPTVHVIKSYDWFCINAKCPFVIDGVFATRDGSHLTYQFVRKITPIISATLDSFIK